MGEGGGCVVCLVLTDERRMKGEEGVGVQQYHLHAYATRALLKNDGAMEFTSSCSRSVFFLVALSKWPRSVSSRACASDEGKREEHPRLINIRRKRKASERTPTATKDKIKKVTWGKSEARV